MIFEVIAALKVSNSLSVQQWSLSPAACAGVFPFNVPCFRHRVVIALEKLRLRIESRPTLGETARLAMQRRDVLTNRPVEAFQERS